VFLLFFFPSTEESESAKIFHFLRLKKKKTPDKDEQRLSFFIKKRREQQMSASDWNVKKVCTFLKEKEVDEEIVDLFRDAKVDGSKFLNLNDESLKSLGIKLSIARKHILGLIADLVNPVTPEPDSKTGPLDYGRCEEHKKNQRTSVYCDTCQTPLCDVCIVTSHKGHTFTSISAVAKKIRESLKEKTSSLEEISKGVCENIISECFQSLEKLKENRVSCDQEVKAGFDALQRALDEAKERILKKIDESSAEKEAHVKVELNHTREWKKEGELLIREVKDLMAQDDVLLMRNEHIVSPQIHRLLSSPPTMEGVQEVDVVTKEQAHEQLVEMFERVVSIIGLHSIIVSFMR
jgi:hypothetical protein